MLSTPITAPAEETEARRLSRINLTLPIRIECKIDQKNSWSEVTRLRDVSALGAGFLLPRPVKRGRIVKLTIPLPRQLRCYDHMEPQYQVYGLVRTCVPVHKAGTALESYALGTAFIGKKPPFSYFENPALLYDLTARSSDGLWGIQPANLKSDESHLPKEQRRHSRFPIPVTMLVETLDENGNVTGSEMTVTENISLGGASIFTTMPAEVGSFMRVTGEQYGITILSIVRGKRVGPDAVPRLHLEFIDHFFPLEGIDS